MIIQYIIQISSDDDSSQYQEPGNYIHIL